MVASMSDLLMLAGLVGRGVGVGGTGVAEGMGVLVGVALGGRGVPGAGVALGGSGVGVSVSIGE